MAFALPSGFCVSHDPARKEQQIAARKAGGRARGHEARTLGAWQRVGGKVPLTALPSILIGAGVACMNGELEANRLTAFVTAARTAVAITEVSILEVRLQELERLISVMRGETNERS